jgi:hypothetical protein
MLVTLCMVVGTLVFSGAPAQASLTHNFVDSFGPGGPGVGVFAEPQSVAVDQSTGNVYVYGSEYVEARERYVVFIYKFNAAGDPEDFSALGTNVIEGSGELYAGFSQIAVDSSSGPAGGDIYVVEGEHVTVYGADGDRLGELNSEVEAEGGPWDLACGVAVDPAGNVYVGLVGGYVNKYTSSGNPVGNSDYESSLAGLGESSCDLAADSEGNVYVDTFPAGPVTKYGASQFGSPAAVGTEIDAHATAVAVGSTAGEDDLYVDEGADVAQYDSSGNLLDKFGARGGGALSGYPPNGVAVNNSSGDIYVSDPQEEYGKGVINIYGPPVVLPTVAVGSVSDLQATSVTLNGTVNPEEISVTACEFEYGTSTSYGQRKACSKALPFTGDSPEAVSANVTGLQPDSTYYFRLTATNASGTEESEGGTLETPGRPTVDSVSSQDLTTAETELKARIDPHGSATTYVFQYSTAPISGVVSCTGEPSACTEVPVPPGEIPAGFGAQSISVKLQSLQPGTTYYYRVLASNKEGEVESAQTFNTFTLPPTPVGVLPDGREWEMVSPLDKGDAAIRPISVAEPGVQAAEDGDALSYTADVPLPSAEGSLAGTSILAARGGKEWKSTDIQTPHVGADGLVAGGGGFEYQLFSSDLSLGLVQPFTESSLAEPPLSPPALPGETQENTLYLRANAEVGAPSSSAEELERYEEASGNGAVEHSPGYLPLVTAANVPLGTKFGPSLRLAFLNATPDLSHVVLRAENGVALTKETAGPEQNLYEWGGVKGTPSGQLKLISVLPKNTPASKPALGNQGGEMRHAISNDGSRVIWTNEEDDHLYLRDTVSSETVQVDAAQGIAEPISGRAQFQTASSNGNRIFFTDSERLTADSTAPAEGITEGVGDLYVFEVNSSAGKLSGTLTDLTVDPHYSEDGEHADVEGLVTGASEDGSYVYFVADGALAGEAEPGDCRFPAEEYRPPDSPAGAMCNLYVEHYSGEPGGGHWEAPKLVATLSGEDQGDWGLRPYVIDLQGVTARVSPNGEYLAFMSERPLTGYDNLDANSGVPDEEVYLYDAGSGRLVCASCNPTGARPVGVFDTETKGGGRLLVDEPGVWNGHWLAGSVPGWTPQNLSYSIYQSRYLSDSGRLFFDSPDDLVPRASNGKEDVYEFEPAGVGSCTGTTSSEGVTYSGEAGGCVGLISSGESSEESAFLDASASGDDVFFVTTSQLVGEDVDNKLDVYDAHVCSAAAPCFPQSAAVPPACTDGASCKAAPTPQPSIFGAPSSQTFSGQGNIVSSPSIKAAAPKLLTRAQKLAKALKTCKQRRSKKKRRGCEARARKQYGPQKQHIKTKKHAKKESK